MEQEAPGLQTWLSSIGNVAGGSTFAVLQSIGVGAGPAIGILCGAAAGIAYLYS